MYRMRGLLPSNAWAHVRLMALFSVTLKAAIGFSGAWGSCLYSQARMCARRTKAIKRNRIRQERQQITEINCHAKKLALEILERFGVLEQRGVIMRVEKTSIHHVPVRCKYDKKYRQPDKTRETLGKQAHLTLRWALRESLPPTEVTLQVYVPMSPDHVWDMCRVPSGSSRRRGDVFTSINEPLFSHTYLKVETRIGKCSTYTFTTFRVCCDMESVHRRR